FLLPVRRRTLFLCSTRRNRFPTWDLRPYVNAIRATPRSSWSYRRDQVDPSGSGALKSRWESKGTYLIVAARCPVCGEPVCLDRSTYQNNFECPIYLLDGPRWNRVGSRRCRSQRPLLCRLISRAMLEILST